MITEKIEIFLEVADSLCFSEVAKKRYTTQPTISRQISALEEEWGVQLFVRNNKGLRLTPEGSIMLQCCQKMYRQCEAGLRMAQDVKLGKNGTLRIGFLEILDIERIFMPYLREFNELHPEVDISVSCESFAHLRQRLQRDQLDIIYTFDFEIQNISDEIVFNPLGELVPMFVISKYHHLFEKENLTVYDCRDEYFYLPEEKDSPGRMADMQRILRAHNISNGKIRRTPNLDSAMMYMRMGNGVSIVDSGTKDIWTSEYRFIPLEKQKDNFELVSVWKKDNLNPFVPMFTIHQTVNLDV